ncbi:hypothetical protein EI427_20400 [Flammeovirga pectinis]|uniref:Secretin/TonB short N-terminal domain-containing protein n=1 Tax=Flammeovirga pectinis TaxID=2494373 RepID=A0A3Q9FT24_9BACT|nr:carboxypeptidase-like regulatory domain-containing protein [Flammeovirga pectinis]AZQ64485.1 hypothetical protein EI427_20400 [Flammeovirga pectinis]
MKYLYKKILFLSSLFLFIITVNASAQEEFFSAEYKQKPLRDALKEIETTFKVYLSFSDNAIKNKTVSASISNATLDKTLVQVLAGTSLSYEILEEQFIVIKKPVFIKKTIQGTIIDDEDEPLPYATILASPSNFYAVSKEDGSFQIKLTTEDTITFQFLGYQHIKMPVKDINTDNPIEVKLQRDSQKLPELVYEQQLNNVTSLIDAQSKGKNVKNSGIGNLPMSSQTDVYYALRLLPGVSTTGLSSALEVRGGESDQNLTLIDNYPMYQLDHYFGLESVINPDVTSSATLYAGGYDCLYGARVSSILDIGLKDPPLYHTEGNVGVSLLGYKGYLSTPIIKGKLAVYGTYRQYHGAIEKYLYDRAEVNGTVDQNSPVESKGDVNIISQNITPDIEYHDANAKVVYQINTTNQISASYLNSQDNYSSSYQLVPTKKGPNGRVPPPLTNSDDRSWTNNAFALNWNGQFAKWNSHVYATFSENIRNRHKISHVRDSATVIKRPRKLVTISNQKFRDISVHSDQQIFLNHGRLDVGTVYTNYYVVKELIPTSFFSNEIDSLTKSNTLGVYGQFNFLLGKLALTAGSRVWYYQPSNKAYIAPRIQGTYNLDSDQNYSLKFSMGRYYQFIRELSDELTYDAYWIISDGEGIPIITSNHFIGGGTAKFGKHSIDIEGYYKQSTGEMSDLIYRNPVFYHKYIGNGKSYGIDVIYEFNTKRFYNYISYGYNNYLKEYTQQETEKKRTHILQLASMYKRKRWKVGITWVLKDTEYSFNNLIPESRGPNIENNSIEPYEIPLYHRLDFSSEYNFRIGKRMKGEVVLTIYDLYNQKNTEERQVTEVGPNESNAYDYILTDVSQLGILPNVSFNLIF